MKKKILIDVDEVVCNSSLLDAINEFLNTNYKLEDFNEYYIDSVIPDEKKEAFYQSISNYDFYENARIIDGAVEVIKELSKVYDVYICSSCVMFYNMQNSGIYFKYKYDFLLKHFPFLNPERFVFTGYKNFFVADVQIDDRIDHLEGEYVKTKLLMTAYHNKNISEEELKTKGVVRVNSWNEIKNLLLK